MEGECSHHCATTALIHQALQGDEGIPLFMSYFHCPSTSQLPTKWRQTQAGEDPNKIHFTSIIQTFQRINNIPWTWVWCVPHVLQKWMLFESGWLLQSEFLLSEPFVPFLDSTVIAFVSHSEGLKAKKTETMFGNLRLPWWPSSPQDSIYNHIFLCTSLHLKSSKTLQKSNINFYNDLNFNGHSVGRKNNTSLVQYK